MPAGTGLQFSAFELPSWAKAPSRGRLMILSPIWNCVTPSPMATISPAASLPGMNGGSGRNWYLPASIRTSTYCTPRASMRTCTSPGPGGGGSGTSRSASTSGPPNASHTIAFIARPLSPIVESIDVGPAVARLVWPMHRDDLDLGTKSACAHVSIGSLTREIKPRDHLGHADLARQRGAAVEQRRIARSGSQSQPRSGRYRHDCGPDSA